VLLNPAPAAPLSPPLLRQVGILTPNESEAAQLSGVEVRTARDAVRAAQILRRQGAKTVIVTRGARGAVVVSDAGVTRVPAFRVRPVDTTAAGDVFNGALAVALGGGRALPDAVRFAAAAAALSVTRPGAQPSVPRRAAIHRLLAAPPPPAAPGTTGRAGRT
jgi:ribokinase